MPQLYSTGPAMLFANIGTANAVIFFGTCRQAPVIQVNPAFHNVVNDLTGGQKPLDVLDQGQDAMVSGVMNRFNESAYQFMADRANATRGLGLNPGTMVSGQLASLLLTEGLTFQLWVVFPYAPKTFFQNAGNGVMPAGYHFLNAYLLGPDRHEIGATQEKAIHMAWHCLQLFDPTTAGTYNTGQLVTYNFDCSATAGIPIS